MIAIMVFFTSSSRGPTPKRGRPRAVPFAGVDQTLMPRRQWRRGDQGNNAANKQNIENGQTGDLHQESEGK